VGEGSVWRLVSVDVSREISPRILGLFWRENFKAITIKKIRLKKTMKMSFIFLFINSFARIVIF
jgi:hypothetical protein